VATDRAIGSLALAVGVIALASIVSLALFFVVSGPFGTISDLGNAVIAVLSGLLAWALRRRLGGIRNQAVGVGVGVLGAGVAVVGSVLVISAATGFFLAGLVSSVGFGCIGLWLLALSSCLRSEERLPRWLPVTGIIAGAVMALGLVTLPGIVVRLDDLDAAPGWIWIGLLGWLGVYLVYPAWSVFTGRILLRNAVDSASEGQGA
jgi:hypothetical protein